MRWRGEATTVVVWLLPLVAWALPRRCEVSIGSDFLLAEQAALKCGLPSSRSYLLSKYGLVLVAEAPTAVDASAAVSVVVRGCDATESLAEYPWFDKYTTNVTEGQGAGRWRSRWGS